MCIGVDHIELTVQPFGVVFDSSLERMHLLATGRIEKVSPEDYRVCFGEFGNRAAI